MNPTNKYPQLYHLSCSDVNLKEFNPEPESAYSIEVEISILLTQDRDSLHSYSVLVASTNGYIEYLQKRSKNYRIDKSTAYLQDRVILLENYTYEQLVGYIGEIIQLTYKLSAKHAAVVLGNYFNWLTRDEAYSSIDFYTRFLSNG